MEIPKAALLQGKVLSINKNNREIISTLHHRPAVMVVVVEEGEGEEMGQQEVEEREGMMEGMMETAKMTGRRRRKRIKRRRAVRMMKEI